MFTKALCTKFHQNQMMFHWDTAISRFLRWLISAILFYRTSCLRSTPVTWLHWSFWICLQPSTPLTTQFCSDDLKHLGSEEPLYWYESYLVGRRQHVRTPATSSSPTVIECGVPQGSVLDPILFLHIWNLITARWPKKSFVAALQLLIED